MILVETTVSALPDNGLWGSFARWLLEAFATANEHYRQQRMMLAVRELDHPGVLADMEAARRR